MPRTVAFWPMESAPPSWQPRLHRFLVGAQWVALTIGIVASVYQTGGSPDALVAGAIASIYVLITTAAPLRYTSRPFIVESLVLVGTILVMIAVTLTGARDSPFLLLSLTPTIHAAIMSGPRTGLATATLSGLLLTAVELSQDREGIIPTIGIAILYLVIAATVSQLLRVLRDMSSRAAEFEQRSMDAGKRLEALERAHELLTRLATMTGEGINITSIGRTALEAVVDRENVSGAVASIDGARGPVIVARVGEATGHHQVVPLSVGARDVGQVTLLVTRELSETEQGDLEGSLRPLALAFANALLLQEIAAHAIEAERVRVARDLHDEIGPSLASLGLSLDVAMLQHPAEPQLAGHLQQLRENVTGLVEDIRTTVADLRSEPTTGLRWALEDLAANLTPGPDISIDIDEQRPPRPSVAADAASILGEALRNAHRHASANRIRIHGWTNYERGLVHIEDDGKGFDPKAVGDGHFGLIGMRERAERSNLDLQVKSDSDGTLVSVSWGLD
jgi:signal transduction histidine kinase